MNVIFVPKWRLTNETCDIKVQVKNDRSEPVVTFDLCEFAAPINYSMAQTFNSFLAASAIFLKLHIKKSFAPCYSLIEPKVT